MRFDVPLGQRRDTYSLDRGSFLVSYAQHMSAWRHPALFIVLSKFLSSGGSKDVSDNPLGIVSELLQ